MTGEYGKIWSERFTPRTLGSEADAEDLRRYVLAFVDAASEAGIPAWIEQTSDGYALEYPDEYSAQVDALTREVFERGDWMYPDVLGGARHE